MSSKRIHRILPMAILIGLLISTTASADEGGSQVARYVRFQAGDRVAYGLVEGDRVRELSGDLFGHWKKTAVTHSLSDITPLVPTVPSKVIALAGNYRDHIGEEVEREHPEAFYKIPSCLQRHEGEVRLLTENVHYEAEMVIVIGKTARHVDESSALDCVLGVTCGNDISARDWQANDVQWWRAKACDTYGPCGPFIVSGLDYDNLDMEIRVNGEVHHKTNTKLQIHGVAQSVSFLSKHITLEPGDLIFTGTSGTTRALHPGDVVEVEIEGVGVLRNHVIP